MREALLAPLLLSKFLLCHCSSSLFYQLSFPLVLELREFRLMSPGWDQQKRADVSALNIRSSDGVVGVDICCTASLSSVHTEVAVATFRCFHVWNTRSDLLLPVLKASSNRRFFFGVRADSIAARASDGGHSDTVLEHNSDCGSIKSFSLNGVSIPSGPTVKFRIVAPSSSGRSWGSSPFPSSTVPVVKTGSSVAGAVSTVRSLMDKSTSFGCTCQLPRRSKDLSIAFGSNGTIPHFRNPCVIVSMVKLLSKMILNMALTFFLETQYFDFSILTFPICFAVSDFIALYTATSNGCVICVVFDGKHSKITSFFIAKSISCGLMWDTAPSWSSRIGRSLTAYFKKIFSNHWRYVSLSINPLSVVAYAALTGPFLWYAPPGYPPLKMTIGGRAVPAAFTQQWTDMCSLVAMFIECECLKRFGTTTFWPDDLLREGQPHRNCKFCLGGPLTRLILM